MRSLLVANRGEIALRVARTARRMGLRTIGVYSDADRDAPHRAGFDECIGIGASYLDVGALLDAARRSAADAVHPGYGFLSENPDFARAVIDAGLRWIGPPPDAMRAMAHKGEARRRAAALGVPVLPGLDGSPLSLDELHERSTAEVGFPMMVKAAAGGGGRGMRRVESASALRDALASAWREAAAAFGDGRLIAERALDDPRHVEVQVFADTHGNVVHLGERDCSVQRRHQKIVEEAPCPALDAAARRRLGDAAAELARDIGYVGAGTVEFLFESGTFSFMEMNTRLQVEHPVTEALLGVDLVEWQLRVARGEPLPMTQHEALARFESGGHAIEARLCAEDASRGFVPCTGTLHRWQPPAGDGVRCDHALADGLVIGSDYDPMLAKVIAHSADRDEAIDRLAAALDGTVAHGVTTNRGYLARLLRSDAFRSGDFGTGFVARHLDAGSNASSLEALAAGVLALCGERPIAAGWRGWTSAGPFETDLPLRIDGEPRRWRVFGRQGDWRVECGERRHVLAVLDDSDPGRLGARLDGRDVVVALTRRGATLWLQACGEQIAVVDERLVSAASGDARASVAGALRAPMHGRLLRLPAAGTEVRAGDVLAVIEAMKIEHPLAAPASGTVRAVHAKLGDQVAAHALLLEIDTPDGRGPGVDCI